MNRLMLAAFACALGAPPLLAADPAPAAPAAAPAPAKAPAKTPAKSPAKAKAAASGPELKTDDERALYAYGYKIGQNIGSIGVSDAEAKIIAGAVRDAATGKGPAVNMIESLPLVRTLVEKRVAAKAVVNKEKGKAFADAFGKQDGVKPIPMGGWYQSIKEGDGAALTADDKVKVHYRGTLIDGTEFDSSYKRGEPATFPLKGVIPCWTNGVAMMKVHGKAKLVCPSDVAYGDDGHPPVIPGGATLIFEVELLEIVKDDAPEAPRSEEKKPAAKDAAKKQ